MKNKNKTINNPDELNKSLSYSSPATWITLSLVILILAGFFAWSFIYKIQVKIFGTAKVTNGNVALEVKAEDLASLKEGQKVYIAGVEGQILSIEDNKPVVSQFTTLNDGDYDYYVVVNEMKPIDFWFNNK